VDGYNIRGEYLYISRGTRGGATSSGAPGAVQSTIPDMARYASALLRRGAKIVRPETFAEMVSPQWDLDPRLPSWGFSFSLNPSYVGRATFGHDGGVTGGWNTSLDIFPEEGAAVLIHCNLTYEKFGAISAEIVRAALGDGPLSIGTGKLDATVRQTAPGVYEAPSPGPLTNFRAATGFGRIQISEREGDLLLHARRSPWKHGVRLLPTAYPDLFIMDTDEPAQPRLAMVRDDGGNVCGLRFAYAGLWTMVKNPEIKPWA
jgi:hypothetical protein